MKTTSSFRLPDELRERIRDQAAAERRSFSNECRVLLEAALVVETSTRDKEVQYTEGRCCVVGQMGH
jgi:plasmid stability protein